MGLIEHEVWEDEEGKTMLCRVGTESGEGRKLIDPNSKIIYTFFAGSHFEAMTKYYKFMGWGKYETTHETDKAPYKD